MNRDKLMATLRKRTLFSHASAFLREAAILVAVFVPLATYIEKEKTMGLGAFVGWLVFTVVLFWGGIAFEVFTE